MNIVDEDFRRTVEANLDRDPMQIALDGRVPCAAAVASQVKYLRRAESKLPSWYTARCFLPPVAFEQSSSQATASRKNYSGRLCIDLTCGLGVDALHLSKKFERVITLERDGELAAIARSNFGLLGADNIEVVYTSAERFLDGVRRGTIELPCGVDLIYADPDRRSSEGKKMVRIEDCSPDVATLLPLVADIAPRMVVKLSPMFDVDEAFRIFGPRTRVEVVSLGGETKEIVVDVEFTGASGVCPGNDSTCVHRPAVAAVAIGLGEAQYPFGDGWIPGEHSFEPHRYRWLIVPDVALQKARLGRRYFSEWGANAPGAVYIDSDNGYAFAEAEAEGVLGRVFEIESIEPFDPKQLKRRLRAQGARGIDIMRRGFPLSTADIARALGVREGGADRWAFTRADGRLWQMALKP